jgi:mRNA-degrading endonuclease RelE of RelBE toxin-antitoxin system
MGYKFVFHSNAQKEFENLTQGQRKAISDKFRSLEVDPMADGKTLDGYAPLRRVKAGDVRVIYDPEPDSKGRLFILRIGTDHSIYDLGELAENYWSKR